ncbi:ABC multidrug transporter-like protein [Patellaria atrata CBS 101060]|uniref:ABC multidrug transporter-like protein n=1 Tax=Patellaria atrata CBS 101060 TaxID=1346257 RepID=A0A9P4VUM8_9PEZI|nr:ABC multidrug transporter-like protein [Patellaria atrata CBS 101060]
MSTDGDEKKRQANDQIAASQPVINAEPVAIEPLPEAISKKELGDEVGSEDSDDELGDRIEPFRTASRYTQATSLASEVRSIKGLERQKKWHDRINPLKRTLKPPIPKERAVSREYNASFFSRLTFQWMAPIMAVGYQRPLEVNDIWSVNPKRTVQSLEERLTQSFKRRTDRGDEKPLLGAIWDTFKKEIIIAGICQLTASIIQVLAPFTLKYLIAFATRAYIADVTGRPEPSVGEGLGLVFGITAMQMISSLCTNHFLYNGMMVGGQARAVLISVIFEKSMRISGRAKAGGTKVTAPPKDIKAGSEAEKQWYTNLLRRSKNGKKKGSKKNKDSSADGQGWGNGRIVNLMSTDTYRVDQASGMFHVVWTSPVAILLTLALLLVNITYSALAGFGLLVVSMPLLGRAIRSLFKRRARINKITDQRVSLTQEILQGIRFVKFFGWETAFLERIEAIRRREIRAIQFLLAIRNGINAISMSMPVFASMLAFITYSLTNHALDPAPIFSSLALFNSMRLPLNLLPLVLGQAIDAYASIKRIQEFLMAEEASDEVNWDFNSTDAVRLTGASFTWERTTTQDREKPQDSHNASQRKVKDSKNGAKSNDKSSKPQIESKLSGDDMDTSSTLTEEEPFSIHDINLSVGRKELVAVIGSVGSGKSSLLAALAGDMRRTKGSVTIGASRAFCPQYPWIQNATVRENIIFGRPYDRDWYNRVIDACALKPDLEMLPNGDMTEIGERGITVSGGQKQRLNIARAIYFNADIILMDDPLSAVDAHVGRHIMDNAITGLLNDKCRILATHQLHVLNRCDRIIWIQEGRVEAVDSFDNLMNTNERFAKMMVSTVAEEKTEEDELIDEVDGEEKKAPKRKDGKASSSALMQVEERAVNSVSWGVWEAYVKASGGLFIAPLVMGILILSQGANIVSGLWLSWWTSDKFGFQTGTYIGVYAALGAVQALLMFLYSVALSVFGTNASKVMLHRAINRVLRAPMSFFDTTPLGRIMNRFSKDIDTMDNTLTDSMRMYFLTMAMIISVFALIISYFHYFAIALGPLFVMFIFSAGYYRASAREIKRHESVLRSHVFSRFSEGISGTATVRAYGLQKQFAQSVRDSIDNMNSAYYLTFANQRWLSVRLDVIGNLLVFTTGILVVTSRFNVSPSISGLVLSYILSIVMMLQWTVRQLAEMENNMNATERIHYYGTELEQEAPLKLGEVPEQWPAKGKIVFNDVQMRYRDGLPLVLRGLSMHVAAGERIGVVGRTGAGKSSIMGTLFRLTELSGGSITIDGIDISKIGLHDLRSKLAIIPQDPTLFRGTIRSNLDPFNEHTDLELWSALRQADLVDVDVSMDEKSGRIHLDSIVEEEGLNFSLGQRQLMALARALVRGAQIIVCDEATSSVDMETDQKIQRTIVEAFKGKTLLCIAHRLRTIIGYDRICVMDQGGIAELDTPLRLYDLGGIFRGMCERSGIRREDFEAAKDQ